jgi:hypothetical protein
VLASGTVNTADWIAFNPGNEWTLNKEQQAWNTERSYIGTSLIPINGVDTLPFHDDDGLVEYFTTSDGVKLHRLGGLSEYVSGYGNLDYHVDFSPALPYAPSTMSPGQKNNFSGTATYTFPAYSANYSLSYTSSTELYGIEQVDTVLGSFSSAKVKVEFTITGTIEGTAINSSTSAVFWLVKGLGRVKRWTEHDNQVWVLKSSNIAESSYNQPPIASISALPTVIVETDTLTLDASSSSDPEGKTLSYRWALTDKPAGSTSALSSSNSSIVNIAAGALAGQYQAELTVTDSFQQSDSTSVSWTIYADTDGDRTPDTQDAFPSDGKYSSDSDQDGLPDKWEQEHFSSYTVAGKNNTNWTDTDQDGVDDLTEFTLGTDPNTVDLPTSLAISDITLSSNQTGKLEINITPTLAIGAMRLDLKHSNKISIASNIQGLPSGWSTTISVLPPGIENIESITRIALSREAGAESILSPALLSLIAQSTTIEQNSDSPISLTDTTRIFTPEGMGQRYIADDGAAYLRPVKTEITYTLHNGWNLLSLPYVGTPVTELGNAITVASLLSESYIDSLWTLSDQGNWEGAIAGVLPQLQDITSFNPLQGYWVNVTTIDPISKAISGVLTSDQVTLHAGWNLISAPIQVSDLPTYINANNIESIWTWDSRNNRWLAHIEGTPEFLNSIQSIDAGGGYYMYRSE